MRIKSIETKKAPKAIGPYSQAKVVGDFVFTSGQIAIDPKTNEVIEGNIEVQTKRVLENLKAVLEASGSSLDNTIKVTVYLENLDEYFRFNKVYAEYFKKEPARSTVQVARLPKDVRVEIDVVALKK